MSCYDVPVMEIIKEWRLMAGPKGRDYHKASPVPAYEYEKKHTEQAKQDKQKAEASIYTPTKLQPQ